MCMRLNMKNILSNKYFKFAAQIAYILAGCVVMGIAYNCFFAPNSITPTGFMGLSTIITTLLARADIVFSPSIIYLCINVILFLIALKFFGWRFGILTVIGILGFTVATEFIVIPELISSEPLLAVFVGGAMNGVGCGIVMRAGGSTGGSDIVAIILNKYFPNMKTGTCSFIISAIVVILSMIVNGVALGLYAIIGIFLSGKALDLVLDGSKSVRAFYIICDKDKEVAERILQTFHRGVTRIDVEGAFSNKEKKMLLCLVTNQQAPAMKSIIKEVDPNSFVFSTTVRETLGESFFLREASVRKNKIRNATSSLKLSARYNRKTDIKKTKFKLARRNKLRYIDVKFYTEKALEAI